MSLAKHRQGRARRRSTFASHIDGSRHVLTPERSIADPGRPARRRHRHAARRMRRLAGRGGARRRGPAALRALGRALQGGVRRRATPRPCSASSRARPSRPCAGNPPSGCSRSASTATPSAAWRWARATRRCARCSTTRPPLLPADRPRYLMGVGKPVDLVEAVARGRRHVRLRAAHPLGPPRPGLDLGRPDQPEERPLRRGRRRRWTRPSTARPAATIPAPTCTTWSSRARSSARCCSPGTTSPSSRR